MIEVLEYKPKNGKIPDTFGYMSLGSISGSYSFTFTELYLRCRYLEKEFEILLLNFFNTEDLLVLGNLDCLPGDFIVDRDGFLTELKGILESKLNLDVNDCDTTYTYTSNLLDKFTYNIN